MFDVAPTELLLVAVVALVVIGPKDLPRVMRVVGYWVGRARGVARHFRSGLDSMMREAELEEMERRWKAENERIMREHPLPPGADAETVVAADGAAAIEGPIADPSSPADQAPAGDGQPQPPIADRPLP